MKGKNKLKNNYPLIIAMSILVIFGCVMVYSASYYSAGLTYNNQYYFLIKQIVGVVLGFIAFFATSMLDYNIYKKFYLVL